MQQQKLQSLQSVKKTTKPLKKFVVNRKKGGERSPRNETIKKVLVLGSGAIKIGEAGESQQQ